MFHQQGPELVVIEDPLEDRLVVIHPSDDRVHEAPVEGQPKVRKIVLVGLSREI
jgi:hypothetical protein